MAKPSRFYYNDKGFQLGNLLYVLLRAYKEQRRGINSRVLYTGYADQALSMFYREKENKSKYNLLNLFTSKENIEQDSKKAVNVGYYQRHNIDYTTEDINSFISDCILPSLPLKSVEGVTYYNGVYPLFDCTLAIRRTDYTTVRSGTAYMYDVFDYLSKVFQDMRDYQSSVGDITISSGLSLRITSDDVEWCRNFLLPWIKENDLGLFNNSNIIVEDTDRVENFYQLLSTSKYFISPNSTFCFWVAYILRYLSPSHYRIYVPDYFTSLVNGGRQIHDVSGMVMLPVNPVAGRGSLSEGG